MNPAVHPVDRRQGLRRLDATDSEDLRRNKEGSGRQIVSPAPRVAQPLRLEQVGFTPAQLLLRLLARIDIRQQVVPTNDAVVGVAKREATRLEPAIFAVGSTDAMLELVRLPGLDRVLPGGRHLRQVGRMHGISRPPLPQLFKRATEVVEDLAVDVLNPAVGCHDGDEAGKGLNDEAEALFAGGRSLLGLRPRFALV